MAKRSPPGPLEYLRRWPLQAWLVAVGVFLYAPLVALMVFSFNDSRRNIVWQGFTLKYYEKALNNASLIEAFVNSLTIAAVSTVLSLVLGAMAALALWRFRFPGKAGFDGALALPIVAPEICLGVAMLVFFAKVLPWPQDLPWPLNLGAIIETLQRDGTQTIMVQRYLPAIAQGDKRVLVIGGKPVPYALARIPQGGEVRGNLAAWGKGMAQPLSERDLEIATTLGPTLAARGLLLVGLDVIGECLTEINVTSPTCFREIMDQTGFDVAATFVDALEQALA